MSNKLHQGSPPLEEGRASPCSAPACPAARWGDSTAAGCRPLGWEPYKKQVGSRSPSAGPNPSDIGGKDMHLELSETDRKSLRQRGEKGKVRRKVERTLLTHLACFSICLCDVAVSY